MPLPVDSAFGVLREAELPSLEYTAADYSDRVVVVVVAGAEERQPG